MNVRQALLFSVANNKVATSRPSTMLIRDDDNLTLKRDASASKGRSPKFRRAKLCVVRVTTRLVSKWRLFGWSALKMRFEKQSDLNHIRPQSERSHCRAWPRSMYFKGRANGSLWNVTCHNVMEGKNKQTEPWLHQMIDWLSAFSHSEPLGAIILGRLHAGELPAGSTQQLVLPRAPLICSLITSYCFSAMGYIRVAPPSAPCYTL